MSTPYPLALPPVTGDVFVLDAAAISRGIAASRASPRLRIMLPMQRAASDGVQRLINFVQPGSYIRAHQHPMPRCVENITVLQGALGFLTFDENGGIKTDHHLVAGNAASCMADIEQGVWHTFFALAPDTVVLEIKHGPYDAATDKRFADWSPAEDSPEAAVWLREAANHLMRPA